MKIPIKLSLLKEGINVGNLHKLVDLSSVPEHETKVVIPIGEKSEVIVDVVRVYDNRAGASSMRVEGEYSVRIEQLYSSEIEETTMNAEYKTTLQRLKADGWEITLCQQQFMLDQFEVIIFSVQCVVAFIMCLLVAYYVPGIKELFYYYQIGPASLGVSMCYGMYRWLNETITVNQDLEGFYKKHILNDQEAT